MAKLNPNLCRSMLWDLQEIVRVAEDVKSRVGHIECMSWRYPTKRCDSIDVLAIVDQHLGPPGEHYVKILELLYDRLLFLFNLFMKFFDTLAMKSGGRSTYQQLAPCSRLLFLFNLFMKFFDTLAMKSGGRSNMRPRDISMGSIVHVCWDRLLKVQEVLLQQMVSNIMNENGNGNGNVAGGLDISHDIVCRGTQTQECSLLTCENCTIAENMLRALIREIETQSKRLGVASAVVEERMRIKETMLHMSQWSAMHRWVDAIIQDTSKMIREIECMATLNKSLRDQIKVSELKTGKEIHKYQDRIRVLDEENVKLLEEVRNKEANYTIILEEKENLKLTNSANAVELVKWKKESKLSESLIQKHTSHIQVLESEKEAMTRRLQRLEKLEVSWEQERKSCDADKGERDAAERKIHQLEKELDELKTSHATEMDTRKSGDSGLKEELDNQRKLNAELESRNKSLEDAAASADSKYQQAHAMVAQLEGELKRNKLQQTVLLEYPDLNGPLNCQTKVKGNPIKDMECQHQANELRIELLQTQNAKLLRTINKLKSFSTKNEKKGSSSNRK